MLKRLLAALMLVFVAVSPISAWEEPKAPDEKADKTVREVLYEGQTDLDMVHAVRSDLQYIRDNKEIKTLRITLVSPGGPALTAFEIARLLNRASERGLVVEIHATALCASGCTFVLAAGTPGRRFITKETLFFVHPMQDQSGCVKYTKDPKTDDEKIKNTLLDMGRDAYMKYTKRPQKEVESWLTCGNEQAGGGDLAVKLNMADKVEP